MWIRISSMRIRILDRPRKKRIRIRPIPNFVNFFPIKVKMFQEITLYDLYKLIIYMYFKQKCNFIILEYDIMVTFVDFYASFP